MVKEIFNNFEQSVIDLSKNLPQWNTDCLDRKAQSAISSLFEEAGEISGLISKYRTRKHYYDVEDYRTLDNYNEIRTKFVDESGDLLWVLVCSINCLITKNKIDIFGVLTEADEDYSYSFETSLFDLIRDISTLQQQVLFDGCISNFVVYRFEDLLLSFRTFLLFLNKDYDITLEEIINFNMNKLGLRYDSKGQRTDEKQ